MVMFETLDVIDYRNQEESLTLELIENTPLSKTEKNIIDMRVAKEMSIKEIAETLNLTEKQVYNALARARQKIKVKK